MKVKQVLGYRVLVRRTETKSEGGLILPDEARSLKALHGTVVQVGPEVTNVTVGDTVAWGKYGDVVEIPTDDGVLIVMNSEDILLTLD